METELKTPYEYYPLDSGRYVIYTVDTIQYHETIPDDTSHYQVKELINGTFYDNENRLNYKIERYIRTGDTVDWILSNVWSVLAIDDQIQKTENNLRFIKLVSPVKDGTGWKGNIYLGGLEDLPFADECNRLDFLYDWNYEYKNAEQPQTINGLNFNKTVTIAQTGDINAIEYNYAEEIYASGVGMISKEFYHYTNDQVPVCDTCTWNAETILCGYSVIMKVIEHN